MRTGVAQRGICQRYCVLASAWELDIILSQAAQARMSE